MRAQDIFVFNLTWSSRRLPASFLLTSSVEWLIEMEKALTTVQAIQEVIVVLPEGKIDAESKQQGQHTLIYDVV